MSLSGAIDQNNPDPDYQGKFYPDLIPWEHPQAQQNLGQVLAVGNQALSPTTGLPQDATDFATLGCLKIETGIVGQGNNLALQIGEAGDELKILGAITKGSLLVGNGAITESLPVGANGLVLKANSATATGLEWGADASGGTVEAVNAGNNISVGGTISQPIVNLASPLTSTLGMGSVALTDKVGASGTVGQFLSAGTGGETLWATPPDTLPTLNAGTNIAISGTQANPTIAFATPTTSDIQIGVGQQIISKDNYATPSYTMSIDSTGLNDTYLLGGVENKEDIAISSTSVVDTISTSSVGSYLNSAIITCDQQSVVDAKSSQNLVSGGLSTISMTCNAGASPPTSSIAVSCSIPTTPPNPDESAGIFMSCSDPSNPNFQLVQSTPFAPSYTTTFDKNGIVQNNSTGTGFNLQSAQNIALTTPAANVINITNGNNIEFLDPTATGYTTTVSKQGVDTNYFVAGSASSNADLTNNAGNAELLLSASNLAAANSHLLRLEVPQSGNAVIEHTTIGTPVRNLTLSTQGQLTATAGSSGFSISGSAGGTIATNAGGQLLLTAGATGGEIFTTSATSSFASPLYSFENTNASNASYPVMRFSRPVPASAAGDTIGGISYWADDAAGVYREWSRIAGFAQNTTTGNQDGRIGIWTSINGATPVEVFNFNGADNENNSFRPLDLNGNALKTSSGNLTIEATASSGTGNIVISPKVNTGISTLKMTGSAVGDELVVEKNTNFADFYQTGGALLNSNAQMRLGNGGLRMITSSAVPPTFGLDNASFATATHQFTGSNYDLTLPSTGSVSFTNVSTFNLKGGSIQTSTGDAALDASLSSGTGNVSLQSKATGSVVLDSPVITLKNTNTTTSTPNHNAQINTTSSGVSTNTFLKLKLGLADIWIPYFTTDPSV